MFSTERFPCFSCPALDSLHIFSVFDSIRGGRRFREGGGSVRSCFPISSIFIFEILMPRPNLSTFSASCSCL